MYSKNDYRYYLEHRMSEENYLAHYGVPGMKWKHKKNSSGDHQIEIGNLGIRIQNPKNRIKDVKNMTNGTRKKSRLLVNEDNARGQKRTSKIGTSASDLAKVRKNDSTSRTKKAPNMYSTRKKSHYGSQEENRHITFNYTNYGQAQKRADMKADKRDRHKAINSRNPYSYDKNKSIKSNITSNKSVSKKRKALKKKSDKQVDKLYG